VIDELAFIACARTYPENNFVTRAVEDAAFIAPAVLGDVLEFNFGIENVGRTSVRVRVEMIIYNGRTGKTSKSFDGCVVLCDGKKDDDFIFLNRAGRPYQYSTIYWSFRRASEGIVDLKPSHVTRSTAISHLIDTYGLRTAQVGHSNFKTTDQYNQEVDLVKVKPKIRDTSMTLGEKSDKKVQ
jgi:hypothetical protein